MLQNNPFEHLVEIDNLGEANANPSPYTVLWWYKQILEAVGGTVGIPFETASTDFIDINENTFTDILVYELAEGETLNIGEVLLTLKGFSADFVIEYYDGNVSTVKRRYSLNNHLSTFSENLNTNWQLPYVSTGSNVKVKAKMNGKNQQGKAYAVLNGYK